MFQIIRINNPFSPHDCQERFLEEPGGTVAQIIESLTGKPGPEFFDVPTLVMLNGEPVLPMAAEGFPDAMTFDTCTPNDGDTLSIVEIPGDIVTIIIAIVVAIVAVLAVTMMAENPTTRDAPAGDTVYNLRGQGNQFRLGDAIEVRYGRNRIWPSYAAPPFNQYVNNDQIQYSLFCLGLGEFEIDPAELFIEDTPFSAFSGITYEILEPGEVSTLFPAAVITSVEVSGIELKGTNEVGHDWSGGFVLNAAGTRINRIEIDVAFLQGLYYLTKGLRFEASCSFQFQYREINDAGAPVGAGTWVDLTVQTIIRRTSTPQRITYGANVTLGRYEVRGKRTSTKNTSASVISTLTWESARGFSPMTVAPPGVTLLATRIVATNQLNNNTRSRVNLFATRKVPVYNSGTSTWSAPVANANPIWAICDVFRSDYGGQLDDTYLDLESMAELANTFDTRGDEFNGAFDSGITVWDAAKAIAKVGRACPIPQGSRITVIRDEPQAYPAALFNQHNIVEESLTEELQIFEFGGNDSLHVEYTDPVTWKPMRVLCQLPGFPADNPDTVKLLGITDRNQAYHEGMFMLACRMKQRANYSFETGLEGQIPTYLDLVGVTHDTLDGPRGGMVLDYESGTKTVTLSEKVHFAPGMTHAVIFRKSNGSTNGAAIVATAGPTANKIVLASHPVEAFDFTPNQVPPLYFFGIKGVETIKGKVVDLDFSGETDRVKVKIVEYVDEVYSYDGTFPPPPPGNVVQRDPDLPAVAAVSLAILPDRPEYYLATWRPAAGSQGYVIERTFDVPVTGASTWERLATVNRNITSLEILTTPGGSAVRVAALGAAGVGPWAVSAAAAVGVADAVPAAPVLNAAVAFTGLSASASWQPVANANGYAVKVYKTSDLTTLLREEDTFSVLNFAYTSTMMAADSATPSRNLTFRVVGYNSAGDSAYSQRDFTNPAPGAPTAPTFTEMGGTNRKFSWTAPAGLGADFAFYRVYGSAVAGFTPGAGNQIYQGTLTETTVSLPAGTYYWRVAAFDVWASGHADATPTAEQTAVMV